MSTIGRAFEIALKAHQGQTDKAGMAYIGHVARVAAGVAKDQEIIVALLHDVIEDCEVSLADLEEDFPPEIVAAVNAITKRDGEDPDDYYTRVKANSLATQVKLSDLGDNGHPARLALLDDETRARLMTKYAHAARELRD